MKVLHIFLEEEVLKKLNLLRVQRGVTQAELITKYILNDYKRIAAQEKANDDSANSTIL